MMTVIIRKMNEIDFVVPITNPIIKLSETQNKGIRGDGARHPHSWSIVDQEELIEWILK